MFSNAEYTDMHYYYGMARGNANEAVRLYVNAFPNRRRPSRRVFERVHVNLRESGSFKPLRDQQRFNYDERADVILQHFDDNAETSVRRASAVLDIPRETIRKTLIFDGRHPYHLQKVQELFPGDAERRMEFCRWFINSIENDWQFPRKILWTDEATFTRSGVFNQHNSHLWAHENPYAMKENSFQRQFKVNVWAGLFHNQFIGPYVLPDRVNSENFLEFLETSFPELMEEVPLNLRHNMWFQLDGCPAHYGRRVRNWLRENFPERWIGRGGPALWPPRSPDLTPLDFFLWGTLKEIVYRRSPANRDQLMEAILQSRNQISQRQIAAATASMRRRCRRCINVGGNHFEALPH